MTAVFFRNRLVQTSGLYHSLAVFSNRMRRHLSKASSEHLFDRQVRAGKCIESTAFFGLRVSVVGLGGVAGSRSRLPTCLIEVLQWFKHAFNELDEAVVPRCGVTPTLQYFSDKEYFENRSLLSPTQIVSSLKLVAEESVEELLFRTAEVAGIFKFNTNADLYTFIVDSTVQDEPISQVCPRHAGRCHQGLGRRGQTDACQVRQSARLQGAQINIQ